MGLNSMFGVPCVSNLPVEKGAAFYLSRTVSTFFKRTSTAHFQYRKLVY